MPEFFEQESEPGFLQRYLGGWRVIASAWVVAIIVVLAFGGMQAFASRHVTSARQPSWQQQSFVGAVIPRHDPSCGRPGDIMASATPNCQVVGDVLERAEAQTEAEASYSY
jgi:hypothetical protein